MSPNWFASLDHYCERTDASFWSEPLNAVSNGAFILAAVMGLLMLRRRGAGDGPALGLLAIVTAVGIGSFLFHTYANRWSLLADVIPIAVFIYAYFFLAMRRFLGLGLVAGIGVTLAFLVANAGFESALGVVLKMDLGRATNGSAGYFPAALALLAVGGLLQRSGPGARTAGRALIVAAGVFTVSLAFRTMDKAVCGSLPFGTHFLWHALNGLVLFILVRAAILHGPRRASAP